MVSPFQQHLICMGCIRLVCVCVWVIMRVAVYTCMCVCSNTHTDLMPIVIPTLTPDDNHRPVRAIQRVREQRKGQCVPANNENERHYDWSEHHESSCVLSLWTTVSELVTGWAHTKGKVHPRAYKHTHKRMSNTDAQTYIHYPQAPIDYTQKFKHHLFKRRQTITSTQRKRLHTHHPICFLSTDPNTHHAHLTNEDKPNHTLHKLHAAQTTRTHTQFACTCACPHIHSLYSHTRNCGCSERRGLNLQQMY